MNCICDANCVIRHVLCLYADMKFMVGDRDFIKFIVISNIVIIEEIYRFMINFINSEYI